MYIKVHVFPGSKRERVVKKDKSYEIYVKEKAEMNRANNRVREVIAELFNVSKNNICLLSGHRSPKKLFSIDDKFIP